MEPITLLYIDKNLCTLCGTCVDTCPNGFELVGDECHVRGTVLASGVGSTNQVQRGPVKAGLSIDLQRGLLEAYEWCPVEAIVIEPEPEL